MVSERAARSRKFALGALGPEIQYYERNLARESMGSERGG